MVSALPDFVTTLFASIKYFSGLLWCKIASPLACLKRIAMQFVQILRTLCAWCHASTVFLPFFLSAAEAADIDLTILHIYPLRLHPLFMRPLGSTCSQVGQRYELLDVRLSYLIKLDASKAIYWSLLPPARLTCCSQQLSPEAITQSTGSTGRLLVERKVLRSRYLAWMKIKCSLL